MKVTGDKGKIAIVTFPEITSCILRREGFVDYLKENQQQAGDRHGTVSKRKPHRRQESGGRYPVGARGYCRHLRGQRSVRIGCLCGGCQRGKGDQITIIAFDASPAGKQAVYEKQLYDSPQQFPRQMAIGTVDAFIKYMDGEELPKKKFIACQHYYYEDAVKDETRESEQW